MARRATGLLALLVTVAGTASAQVNVSENPVRGDSVIISWPAPAASAGDARVAVFGFTGERLHQATVAAPGTEYVWDLTLAGGARRVVNGAYIVIVEVDGRTYRRRLFIARRAS